MTNPLSTILLIEDEETDRFLFGAAFEEFAADTTLRFVTNGEEAIAYLMGEVQYADRTAFPYPDLIITDIKMPLKDGFDVLKHLKAHPSWAVIPVVVFTSSINPAHVHTAYQLGANSYIIKTGSFLELRSQLKILHDYWVGCQIPAVPTSPVREHVSRKNPQLSTCSTTPLTSSP